MTSVSHRLYEYESIEICIKKILPFRFNFPSIYRSCQKSVTFVVKYLNLFWRLYVVELQVARLKCTLRTTRTWGIRESYAEYLSLKRSFLLLEVR